MAIEKFWVNSGTNLFRIENGIAKYVKLVCIPIFQWTGNPRKDWAEGYVEISALFPNVSFLYEIEDVTLLDFEIDYKEMGEIERYYPDLVFIKLKDCKVVSKRIENIVIDTMDLAEKMTVHVGFDCFVRVLN